eukprot:CAMPEP_0179357942 /NCGR_PEP_ID=MMETSP0797-20121207/78667_1 /TAXON_ID=47934 /ORGANISM="Dinophysis acuminata, Strain DAEP01" /LENGTH=98 /DNA_ID=CAMNT_0021073173 /DNA_START=119 /DNA_END=413 /DNA_ORIENTATION=-
MVDFRQVGVRSQQWAEDVVDEHRQDCEQPCLPGDLEGVAGVVALSVRIGAVTAAARREEIEVPTRIFLSDNAAALVVRCLGREDQVDTADRATRMGED